MRILFLLSLLLPVSAFAGNMTFFGYPPAVYAADAQIFQTSTVVFANDSGGSLNNTNLYFNTAHMGHSYCLWFNINSAGSNPCGAVTQIAVTGATGVLAATLAASALTAINSTAGAYVLATRATATLTITDLQAGLTTNASDAGSTGFTIATTVPASATVNINWANGPWQKLTLYNNCTFTFSSPTNGAGQLLELVQDATGSRTITWPTIRWTGGTAPTLTTTGGQIDTLALPWDGTSYLGSSSLNY